MQWIMLLLVMKDFFGCMSQEGVISLEQAGDIRSFIDDKVEMIRLRTIGCENAVAW